MGVARITYWKLTTVEFIIRVTRNKPTDTNVIFKNNVTILLYSDAFYSI